MGKKGVKTVTNGTVQYVSIKTEEFKQGVTKKCRLSWLTNNTLPFEHKCEGRGRGLRGLSQ
jgi:hypothetical protein